MMLLQDIDLLLKVMKYDYDLTNQDFVLYAKDRGCMNGAGIPELNDPDYETHMKKYGTDEKTPLNNDRGQWRRWVREHWRTFEEYKSSADLRQDLSGKAISDEVRKFYWKCILIAKAQLQDCWEVYCLTEAEAQTAA
jgi:hypothetical protein